MASGIFKKLSLTDQKGICVLDAPDSFRKELASLKGVKVAESLSAAGEPVFTLAFVTQKAQVDKVAKTLVKKARGGRHRLVRLPEGDVQEIPMRLQPRHRLGCAQEGRLRHGAPSRDR